MRVTCEPYEDVKLEAPDDDCIGSKLLESLGIKKRYHGKHGFYGWYD